jgi:FMN-dependent NADH-azoreductase
MKLLHIDSSILGGFSVSRQLSSGIVAKLRETVPGLEIVYRDLGRRTSAPPLWF